MSRQISKQSSLNPRTAALRGVFAPTLLCLALFSATSAMAARSGGYDDVPRSGCYGNVESLTGNQVQITEENDLYKIYGAFATHETTAAVSENTVTISGSNLPGASAYGGAAYAGHTEFQPMPLAATLADAGSTDAISATSNGNQISVLNGTFLDEAFGGYAEVRGDSGGTATANGNDVVISGDSKVDNVYGGYALLSVLGNGIAEASDNHVSITSESRVRPRITGGLAIANIFNVDEAGLMQAIASRNTVNIGGNIKADFAMGGDALVNAHHAESSIIATAEGNRLTFFGNATVDPAHPLQISAAGHAEARTGKLSSATASGNILVLEEQSSVAANVYAGYAVAEADQESTATAKSNSVLMSGTATAGREYDRDSGRTWGLYGGYAEAVGTFSDDSLSQKSTATAEDNSVTLTEQAATLGRIYGGEALAGDSTENIATATGNSVSLTGHSSAKDAIQGGYAWAYDGSVNIATASKNTVTLSDEAIAQGDVLGGYASAEADSEDANDFSLAAAAENNSVILSEKVSAQGDVLGGYAEAYVYLGSGDNDNGTATGTATAKSNRVEISGCEVDADTILGGYTDARGRGTNTAAATMNRVIISEGATISADIFGGYAEAYRGENNSAEAVGNTVVLSGVTLTDGYRLIGGKAEADGEGNNTARASGNSVIVSDGSVVDSNIFGGYADAYDDDALKNEEYATGNTVVIDGAEIVGDDKELRQNNLVFISPFCLRGDAVIPVAPPCVSYEIDRFKFFV